jgi:hypothetical protein
MMAGRAHRAKRLNQAERMRQHREELQLALDESLTLAQARERLASYRDHLPRLAGPSRAMSADRPRQVWWQRD